MSAWKLVTRQLYQAGRPLRVDEFATNPGGSDPANALHEARLLGLVQARKHHYTHAWHLTQHGRDWCEGRVEVAYLKPMSQGGKRTKRATWLMPLPQTNEARITA